MPRRALACLLLLACRLEPPDPAAAAAAILHKHPAEFADRMATLDALASLQLRDSSENPHGLMDSLARYRRRLEGSGFHALPAESRPDALLRFLFDSLAIQSPDSGNDLQSSLPSRVLQARSGSCVGLALLALSLAEAMRLDAKVVLLPGHLFLRLSDGPGSWRNAELLRRGVARPDSFYRSAFALAKRPWYRLASGPPEWALAALVFNVANTHRARGKPSWALSEYRLVREMAPDFPDAMGAEGAVLLAAGQVEESRIKLEAAIAGDSLSYPAWKTYALALERIGSPRAAFAGLKADGLRP